MKEFTFTIRETLTGAVTIEASDETTARMELKEQYEAGGISVDNMEDVEFELKHVSRVAKPMHFRNYIGNEIPNRRRKS